MEFSFHKNVTIISHGIISNLQCALQVQKNKRNVRSRKSLKLVSTSDNEEDGNGGTKGQSSSSCCTGDDSNTYQELSEGVTPSSSPKGTAALNLNGKARATKGSATDPQSVYARASPSKCWLIDSIH